MKPRRCRWCKWLKGGPKDPCTNPDCSKPPKHTLKSVTLFSPSLTTIANDPVGSIAIPRGMLPEPPPELAVVVAVSAPVGPIENAATVPARVPLPEFVTKRKLPAGFVTAWNGVFRLVAMSVVPIRVKSPVALEMENAVTVLAPLFGTKRNCPVGSMAGTAGVFKVVNSVAVKVIGVRPPSAPIL